ncbi:RagB/SusD family nutrient uptake outer membrane protein [Pedobacter xixiisoli]|uniref:SusD family protein n=1 Tax=Pedobacter xixiisoli TaxID=1476464 RepID=A0A286A947_9SPHI|nr:RagB/SusD family nutrient uptake outer membrane protein [Pedobacter xixiisoli]SOD18409.1 SusD family protein [Pedobacter xixiisoli]
MKKYLSILPVFIFLLTLGSCKKSYLDTTPSDQIDADKIFDSVNNVKVALNGVYRAMYMQYSDQEQDGHPAMMIVMDFMGEDIVHTAAGTVYFKGAYRWTDHRIELNDLPYFSYRLYYRIIANANIILEGIDRVPGITPAQKNPIVGECLAIRGWAHFMLVQLFGKRYDADLLNNDPTGLNSPRVELGVPIVTKYSLDPHPRATVEQVYIQVNKDLDEAIKLLDGAPARGIYRTHIDKSVAQGIKARVALTQQNWVDAAKYAMDAMQGYQLMSNTSYLDGFSDMKNSEWMWGAHQLPDQIPAYGSFYAYMSSNFNSSHTRSNPKKINIELYNLISNTDVRKKLFCNDVNDYVNFPGLIDASTGQPASSQTRARYMHKKFVVSDPAISAGDIPYMRVAEMYLIAAEAKARQGLDVEAMDILELLAKNRDPNFVRPTNLTGILTDQKSLIMVQRRAELWGEGFRFLDLKRQNVALSRPTATGHTATLANVGVNSNLIASDKRWQFLLPRRELQANPLMEQNPL